MRPTIGAGGICLPPAPTLSPPRRLPLNWQQAKTTACRIADDHADLIWIVVDEKAHTIRFLVDGTEVKHLLSRIRIELGEPREVAADGGGAAIVVTPRLT